MITLKDVVGKFESTGIEAVDADAALKAAQVKLSDAVKAEQDATDTLVTVLGLIGKPAIVSYKGVPKILTLVGGKPSFGDFVVEDFVVELPSA